MVSRWLLIAPLLLLLGCQETPPPDNKVAEKPTPAPAEGKMVVVGPNVSLEILPQTRRVHVYAEVCLREGGLEQLLTRKHQKEHEAILSADIDAADLHKALLLANAKPGSPVRWMPEYRAPTGTPIRVTLSYTDAKGKKVIEPARSWIRNHKTGKELDYDWVFAGSLLIGNPLDKNAPKRYLANDGDVICVANFEGAMLDLPIKSADTDADRVYDAWTERIPPLGTKVRVILEPILDPAKK